MLSQAVAPTPITKVLRDRLAGDDELRRLQDEARRRRLSRLAILRLPTIRPAFYTRANLGERPAVPEWRAGIADPWPVWLRQGIHHRVAYTLAELFDDLRAGALEALGVQGASGALTAVPAALWASGAVTLDMPTSGLLIGSQPLLFGVTVQPPTPEPRSASRAALDAFAGHFDEAMAARGRRYSLDEAVLAARHQLGQGVSAREVEGALRRMRPTARAAGGRRAACLVPSDEELRQTPA